MGEGDSSDDYEHNCHEWWWLLLIMKVVVVGW